MPQVTSQQHASDRRCDELQSEIASAIAGLLMSRPNEFTYHEVVCALLNIASNWTERGIASEQRNEAKERG